MNQRTLELARQAGLKKEHGSDREYTGAFDWRKFSKLIVKECVLISRTSTDGFSAGKRMEEHFGVEE
jgi:hypothetical protein